MKNKLWAILWLLVITAESNAQYEWIQTGPNGGLVTAMKAIPSEPHILICGLDNGGAFRSADGGESWIAIRDIPSDTQVNDMAVGPFEDSYLIYLSSPSGLYRSDDLGQSWKHVATGPVFSVEAGEDDVVLVQDDSYHCSYQLSYDRGQSWREVEQRGRAATLSPDGRLIYMVAGDVWKTAVDDFLWEQVTEGSPVWGLPGRAASIKINPMDPEQFYVPGFLGDLHGPESGNVMRSIDGGKTWDNIGGGLVTALEIARPTGDVIVGNADGKLRVWNGHSASWDDLKQFETEIRCIEPERWAEDILTVGTLSGIYQTVDRGKTWTRKDRGIRRSVTSSLTFLSAQEDGMWLLTTIFDGAFTSKDAGKNWARLRGVLSPSVGQVMVAPSDPSMVYAGSFLVHRSEDGGRSWPTWENIIENLLHYDRLNTVSLAVNPVDPNHIVTASSARGWDHTFWYLEYTKDGGKNWISNRSDIPPHQIVFDPTGEKLYMLRPYKWFSSTQGIIVVHLTDNTQTVLNEDHYFDAIVINPDRPQQIYAVEATEEVRKLWRTDDGGDSWETFEIGKVMEVWSIDQPKYPGKSPGYFPELRGPSPGHLIIDPHTKGRLFYACYGNGVFLSEDRGESWHKINYGLSNLDVHSIAISPSEPSDVFLATFSGVYRLSATVSVENDAPVGMPDVYALAQNFPNPFNPYTTIRFTVPEMNSLTHVELTIYDLLGRKVRTLMDAQVEAGGIEVAWDGKDEAGKEVSSGVYLYRLTVDSGRWTKTRKMVLIR